MRTSPVVPISMRPVTPPAAAASNVAVVVAEVLGNTES
jgi:hypothetical protein